MDSPVQYVNANSMQRNDASAILNSYIGEMAWKLEESIMDLGCGPGDITADIIYPAIRNKLGRLVGILH